MTHIEFIGPPGAGKTTLYRRLTDDEQFYGGFGDGGLTRLLTTSSSRKRRLFGRYVPERLRPGYLTRMLDCESREEALVAFLAKHPRYLRETHRLVAAVDHQPGRIVKFAKRAATHYQTGDKTRDGDEALCCDELFFMTLVATRWRAGEDFPPVDSFVDVVPTPAALVYVTAPLEVCLDRQRERGQMTVRKPWVTDPRTAQQDHAAACRHIVTEAKELDVPVIDIDNAGQFDDAERKLRTELAETTV